MSQQWKRLQQLMTADAIFEQTKAVIEETLSCLPTLDSSLMMVGMTIGEFKQLKGFHGSKKMLKLLTETWVGRLVRGYVLNNVHDTNRALHLIVNSEHNEHIAVDLLYIYFKETLGEVDWETVNRIELMASQMEINNAEALKTLVEGRNIA